MNHITVFQPIMFQDGCWLVLSWVWVAQWSEDCCPGACCCGGTPSPGQPRSWRVRRLGEMLSPGKSAWRPEQVSEIINQPIRDQHSFISTNKKSVFLTLNQSCFRSSGLNPQFREFVSRPGDWGHQQETVCTTGGCAHPPDCPQLGQQSYQGLLWSTEGSHCHGQTETAGGDLCAAR